MSKRIVTVEMLIDRAKRKGEAMLRREGHEVYRVVSQDGGRMVKLYHYGTLILHVEDRELVNVGGWSVSDRDAINTALGHLNVSRAYVRHSRNGNFLTLYREGVAV